MRFGLSPPPMPPPFATAATAEYAMPNEDWVGSPASVTLTRALVFPISAWTSVALGSLGSFPPVAASATEATAKVETNASSNDLRITPTTLQTAGRVR